MTLFGYYFDGEHLKVTDAQDVRFERCFPLVNRLDEFRAMDAWLAANPRRRPRNTERFVTNWLLRVKDRYRAVRVEANAGAGPTVTYPPCSVCGVNSYQHKIEEAFLGHAWTR